MKTALAILVVFSAFAGVYSFFGLPLEITQVKVKLEGVWSLRPEDSYVPAIFNDALKNDVLGVRSKLQPIVQTIRNTLDTLYARLMEGVSNTTGDTDKLFRQLKEDIQNAVSVISDNRSKFASLSGTVISPNYASYMDANAFVEMLGHMSELSDVVNVYEQTVVRIRASPVLITSENIESFLGDTTLLYDVWPVLALASDMNTLYEDYSWLLFVRFSTVDKQVQANQIMEDNFKNFSVFATETSTNISKSVDEVMTKLKQRAESHLLIMQNTFNYTSILDPDYYNNGEKIITDYFANLTIIMKNCYELYLPALTSNLQSNITVLLEEQKQTLKDSTSETVQFVHETAYLSSNPNSYQCADQTIHKMLQGFSAIDRLKVCYQPEPALIAAIYEEAKTSLDAILDYILIPQEMFTLCDSSSGACFNKFVKHLPKYVQQMKPHIAGALRRIAKQLQLSRSRMQQCGQLVQADMMDFFDQQKPALQKCLQSNILQVVDTRRTISYNK